jgi:hypothetical protein
MTREVRPSRARSSYELRNPHGYLFISREVLSRLLELGAPDDGESYQH